ncbi:MAG: response regulator [Bacteroidales bacterium]|nr:response regulator [Bacteroidales bacterium]
MPRRILLICLLALSTNITLAQPSEYRMRNITNRDGLTNSSVNMIYTDHTGRVWFGTWDGLDRYDGEHIHSFFPAVDNPSTISNNIIREMVELPDGALWIATDRGVDRYDPDMESFTRYFHDAVENAPVTENSFHLAVSPEGEIVTVVDGHGVFFHRDGVFVRDTPLKAGHIRHIDIDRQGRLWMLSSDGSIICDGDILSGGALFTFYDRNSDQVWIQDATGYHAFRDADFHAAVSSRINAAASDGRYHYLGTQNGLFRLNISSGALDCLLPDVPVLSVSCGIQDIIWAGTDMQGVWQLSKSPYDLGARTGIFEGNAVRCFIQDPSGRLAVGTKGSGIFLFAPDTRLTGRLTTKNGLLNNSIYCMEDDGEVIWIGSDGTGLNYQDKSTGRIHTLSLPDSLQISSVYTIKAQGRDSLWAGTGGSGLFLLLLERNQDRIRVTGNRHYTPQQLGSGMVYSLLPSWHGSMFVGTRGAGLQIVRKETGELSRLRSDTDDDILCLARGSDAALWVGTSMGLYRYGDNWEEVTRYSMEDGLPSNTIHGILEDDNGEIWVSTNNGMARIRHNNSYVFSYDVTDGLQDNEFSDGAYYSYGGWFFFGGIHGFNAFDPLKVGKASFMPNLVLDKFYIDNEQQYLKPLLVQEKGAPTLRLDSGNRSLSFHFVPVDFLGAESCELAYRMRGLSDEWVRLGNSHVVAFSNLPPGEYTLEVRSSNEDKQWSDDIFTIRIHKTAPWWRSDLAIALYILGTLLVLLGMAALFQGRIKRQRDTAVHEAKLDFFTNIAHEFSNTLTLIYGPCQALRQSGNLSGTEQQYLGSIISNSDRMRNMMQQLISFRKAETGHLRIHIGKVDMVALVAQVSAYFRDQMDRNDIRFRLVAPPEGLIWTADGDSMEKIVFNLLSNAVKYTPEHEKIEITLGSANGKLNMEVTNTGVGIPSERQAVLFDRYEVLTRFEHALSKGRISNGIGLSLCKTLAEMHKGKITLESDGETYTRFLLTLPLLPVETEGLYTPKQDTTPAVAKQPLHATEKPETPGVREKVLVVDDDAEIRSFIHRTLEPHFSVVEAGNGREALDALEQELPKVVISDMMMPEMDGVALLKALRDDPRTKHIPFILLSGKGTDKTPIEAMENGADAYLDKPFHPGHMLARIHRLLKRDEEVIAYSRSAHSAVEQFAGKEMKKADRELLKSITEVILSHLDDEALTSSAVAESVTISEMQLYRKLKSLTGMSPTEYIRNLRLEHAAQLLRTSNKTVQEIMYSCGFVTKTYFFREFSRRYGTSPGNYRRDSRNTSVSG